MEIIVCILTTLFFAAIEIVELRKQSARASRPANRADEFIVLPFYADSGQQPRHPGQDGIPNRKKG